jgi:hypothetical protein
MAEALNLTWCKCLATGSYCSELLDSSLSDGEVQAMRVVSFIAVYGFYVSAHYYYYYKCLKYTDDVHDPLLDEVGWVLIYWTDRRDKLTWFLNL